MSSRELLISFLSKKKSPLKPLHVTVSQRGARASFAGSRPSLASIYSFRSCSRSCGATESDFLKTLQRFINGTSTLTRCDNELRWSLIACQIASNRQTSSSSRPPRIVRHLMPFQNSVLLITLAPTEVTSKVVTTLG